MTIVPHILEFGSLGDGEHFMVGCRNSGSLGVLGDSLRRSVSEEIKKEMRVVKKLRIGGESRPRV